MKRLIIAPAAAVAVLLAACGTSQSNAVETLPPIRTTTSTTTTTTLPDNRDIIYIVQPGDNVADIARDYQVTAQMIIVLNRLPDDGEIHPGQELQIPNIRVDTTRPSIVSDTTAD